MAHDWHELTDLTGDRPFSVERVRLHDSGVVIEGDFDLPPLARLRYEDQVFVAEFVRNHGSIKDLERAFGISYPTVKNRLNRIVEQLQLVSVETTPAAAAPAAAEDADNVLGMLERGEIDAAEAAERLSR
jgi:hypothetical protein